MDSCESVRQLLDRRRESVVDLVSRCPESITTSLIVWRVRDLQNTNNSTLNGQICMSTDLVVYVVTSVAEPLTKKFLERLQIEDRAHKVISAAGKSRLTKLVTDAKAKGAVIHQAADPLSGDELAYPATIIEGLTPDMEFYEVETLGPMFGIVVVESEVEAVKMVKSNAYGLSAAIFTQNHFNALELSKQIRAGAVHVNSGTVHDEATLPHGGHGASGWGRFGARWGLEEFLHTRTVILNK